MRVEVAKSRASRKSNVLVYGGQEYNLPAAMPLAALEAMESNSITGFLKAIFGPAQYLQFSEQVNTDDLEAIAEGITKMYGGTPGESQASTDS